MSKVKADLETLKKEFVCSSTGESIEKLIRSLDHFLYVLGSARSVDTFGLRISILMHMVMDALNAGKNEAETREHPEK